MAVINLDLVGAYAITPGYEWRINLFYPGNVINASWWGQIWRTYQPNEGLAKFTFDRATYEQALNRTRVQAFIPALQTGGLEPTEGAFYVYEVRLTLARQQPVPIMAGKVRVNQSLGIYR